MDTVLTRKSLAGRSVWTSCSPGGSPADVSAVPKADVRLRTWEVQPWGRPGWGHVGEKETGLGSNHPCEGGNRRKESQKAAWEKHSVHSRH